MITPSKRLSAVFAFGLFIAVAILFALIGMTPNNVDAQTAPTLGTAGNFAVLGGSTVTNTGSSIVNGNLGVAPGNAVVGFPPGVVTPPGTLHAGDAVAMQAQSDANSAYSALVGQPCNIDLTGQDLVGLTLTPGVYCFDSSAQLSGNLTLDAQGNGGAVFIFRIGSTLTTASASSVRVINSGLDCNVWWAVGSSATLGTTTAFVGNILAQASITMNTNTTLFGRALAQTGAVTMDTNVVSLPNCIAQLPTATLTLVPSSTPIPAATATNIPAATATLINTPDAAATATLTNTPDAAATATLINTPDANATATNTPDAAATATLINTPAVGATAIFSVTSTPAAIFGAASAGAGVSGLPNTGGGPPQATYWLGR